jgi:excisionase family DNA binding protein
VDTASHRSPWRDLGPDPEFLRPAAAAQLLGISRALFYTLLARGEFGPVVKLGRATLVPTQAVRSWARAKMADVGHPAQ